MGMEVTYKLIGERACTDTLASDIQSMTAEAVSIDVQTKQTLNVARIETER